MLGSAVAVIALGCFDASSGPYESVRAYVLLPPYALRSHISLNQGQVESSETGSGE